MSRVEFTLACTERVIENRGELEILDLILTYSLIQSVRLTQVLLFELFRILAIFKSFVKD